MASGQRYLDGWTITYNLFRGHHSLRSRMSGYRAKITAPSFNEWADVVKAGAASPQPVKAETRSAPKAVAKIEPPKAGARKAGNLAVMSPIPERDLAAMPKAMRPKLQEPKVKKATGRRAQRNAHAYLKVRERRGRKVAWKW